MTSSCLLATNVKLRYDSEKATLGYLTAVCRGEMIRAQIFFLLWTRDHFAMSSAIGIHVSCWVLNIIVYRVSIILSYIFPIASWTSPAWKIFFILELRLKVALIVVVASNNFIFIALLFFILLAALLLLLLLRIAEQTKIAICILRVSGGQKCELIGEWDFFGWHSCWGRCERCCEDFCRCWLERRCRRGRCRF